MRNEVVIMNFTQVYQGYACLRDSHFSWVVCSHLTGTDCYCDGDAEDQLRQLMEPYPAVGIHWLDSGNYHYLTKLWTDKLDEPFSLVVFDHHPDMQQPRFSGLLSCGGWVRSMLDGNPLLRQVCLIGIAEELKGETQGYGNRLVCYTEQDLKDAQVLQNLHQLRYDEPVYLSIDKDVLSRQYAITNWGQGSMELPVLTGLCKSLMLHNHVIGVDICGEAPELYVPQTCPASQFIRNQHTNEALLDLFMDKPTK